MVIPMQRRHRKLNVPTEIIRSIVTIAELGNLTRAGDKLDLSQATLSSQLKRFESIIGEPAFSRGPGGLRPTERGSIAIASARRMLEANDQIVRLGHGESDAHPIRVGLSMSHAASFIPAWSKMPNDEPIVLRCDRTTVIAEAFAKGLLDVACMLRAFPGEFEPAAEWEEKVVWVRHRDFVISPGAPFPLIDWHGSLSNEVATRALRAAGLSYRFVVTCTDFHLVVQAIEAKIGIIALPMALAAPPLRVATDHYLPQLDSLRAGIYIRDGVDLRNARRTLEQLHALEHASNLATNRKQ